MINDKKKQISELIDKYLERVISIRHHLHKHPELGHQEFKTCEYIRKILSDLKLDILPPFLKTDTVAFINKTKPGKNVTLRADMDALPMPEENNLSYKSVHQNIMHACGHDGHTAILLGTAMVLNELKDEFNGSVRFVFQPAEEKYAGGKDLINKGALDSPKPDAIFALHGFPTTPEGTILSKAGTMFTACVTFKITIKGKGSHGSTPERAIDPILISSKIIDSLYHIPSRCFSALDSVIISICKISSGSFPNIIPATATMEGTIRFLDKNLYSELKKHINQVIKSICGMHGAEFKLEFDSYYLPVSNDKSIIKFSKQVLPDYFDKKKINMEAPPSTGSEDFSFFLEKAPGAIFWLGLGKDRPYLHTTNFNFNDDVIKDGIMLFTALTLEYLKSGDK